MLVYLEPVAKPRQTRADKWRKRPCVMRYRAFADKLRLLVGPVPQGAVALTLVFWIEAPASRRKGKTRVVEDSPHLGKPDLDNHIKAVMDALWEQDSGVWRLTAEKRWTLGASRISIDMHPLTPGDSVPTCATENQRAQERRLRGAVPQRNMAVT